jgi:hypothetical protein
VLNDSINETVIRVRALMITLDALESRIFGDPERESIFRAQLLQLGKDTVGDDGYAFGV